MFKHLILFALLSVVSSGENVHTNRIVDMSLSNDRVFFTSADKDGKVVIWNHSNLTPIKIFEFGDEATIEKIDLDYNGELLAVGFNSGLVKIINLSANSEQSLSSIDKNKIALLKFIGGNNLVTCEKRAI